MRFVVTGGTGFIGSRLSLACLDAGHDVIAFGLLRNRVESENARLVRDRGGTVVDGRVEDRALVRDVVADADVIVHLAAAQHEMDVPDATYWDVNVAGTHNVVEAALEADVGRLVYGSTIGVYGDPEGPVDEESPVEPDNIYGETKAAAEALVRSQIDRLPGVIVRIPETYGPADRRLLKLFRAIERDRFVLIGDGENLHHPIFIDDLIVGLRLAATNDAAVGETLLLPGAEPITTRQMVRAVANAVEGRVPDWSLPMFPFAVLAYLMEVTLRPAGIDPPLHRRRLDFFRKSFRITSSRAARILGFEASTSFADGARRTAEWYRVHGML